MTTHTHHSRLAQWLIYLPELSAKQQSDQLVPDLAIVHGRSVFELRGDQQRQDIFTTASLAPALRDLSLHPVLEAARRGSERAPSKI